jgi:hypothetical protein
MDGQDRLLAKFDTAIFSPNEDNEFGQAGLMTNAREVNKHISVMCNLAKWFWRTLVGAVSFGLPVLLAVGQMKGWW